MMHGFPFSGAMSMVLAATISLLAADDARALPTLTGERPIVIAHRGASGYLPEHTLAAYELAIAMGADYIEPDLQLTHDGKLVAMHDDDLRRTTNVEARFQPRNSGYLVSDFTLAEIKTLTVEPTGTAGTGFPGFTPSSPNPFAVPTFEEVITLAQSAGAQSGRDIGLYPEAKQNSSLMEDLILSTLKTNGYTDADDPVFIQSFFRSSLENIDKKQQGLGMNLDLIMLGVAVQAGPGFVLGLADFTFASFPDLARFASGVGVRIDDPFPGNPGIPTMDLTKDFVAAVHKAGLPLHAWTFNQPDPELAAAEYAQFLGYGIDGLFTNYPDLAVRAVPVPATLPLLALGIGMATFAGRRTRR